jgi:hypothetical protein
VTDLLQAALDYAKAGIPVFPCEPDGKAPLGGYGFEDATTDHGQIKVWWTEHPDAHIGIRPADAGLIALDINRHKGGIDPGLLDQLPNTYTLQSPSAVEHLYFESPLSVGNAPLAQHTDVRSAHGYD